MLFRKLILNSLYVPVVMQLLYEIKQDPGLAETKRWANTIVAVHQKSLDYNDDGAVTQNAQKLSDAFRVACKFEF